MLDDVAAPVVPGPQLPCSVAEVAGGLGELIVGLRPSARIQHHETTTSEQIFDAELDMLIHATAHAK
jgi:hypothetical protein